MDWELEAIRWYDAMELRKDMAMLRVRIRVQRQIGCAEGVARLQREYQRAASRYYQIIDRPAVAA